MRLQGVGRNPRIVIPHFAEERIASDDFVASSIEKFQDRRFFFRQSNLFSVASSINIFALGLKV